MSWNLIEAIRNTNTVDMRPVRPYGLSLKLGDVVKVHNNGNLTLEGSCQTLLGENPLPSRAGSSGDLFVQSSTGTSITFRAAGVGSTLYPELPSAQACFDIEFASAQSWLLACTGRVIHSLTEQNRFRRSILKAYYNRVWEADWALVTEVGMVKKLTLLAATSKNTKLTLSLGATVADNSAMEAKLTAEVSIAKTSSALEQWITNEPASAFCNAVRLRENWFTSPDVVALEALQPDLQALVQAPDEQVWEDVDSVMRPTSI